MRTEARKAVTFSKIIKTAILVCLLIVIYASFSGIDKASAATYPKYVDGSSGHVWLNENYEFYSDGYITYIWNHEETDYKIYLENKEYRFVGKFNGLYYFNKVEYSVAPKGVYTYKLDNTKFKRLKNTKNLNFIPFKRSHDYIFDMGGLSNKRYAIGVDFYPTDAAGAYYVYVYDLKKNTRKTIGEAFDMARDGKKLFWVKASKYPYNSKTKILVKTSNLSGGKRKVYKRYKAGFLKDSYSRGEINKHYVKWVYMKTNKNGETKTYTFKRKYR